MNFKVWLIFVPLWSTFVYPINAFLVWGGRFWGQAHAGASSLFSTGALDYSGGYVIHLAAGVSGFVAAAVIGPRLARDRERAVPNNLPMTAVGAGILWLGGNGFNGGDPYFAGTDAGRCCQSDGAHHFCYSKRRIPQRRPGSGPAPQILHTATSSAISTSPLGDSTAAAESARSRGRR
jgi:hypothetical protein